jgi:Lrp/AsnC family leucine-responsive transcriptional regulator
MLEDLDAIDRKLLSLLQQDGRMSNADLARAVRMAPSAVFERVRRLERDGVIRGYGAQLEPRALERALLAFILVRTDEKTGENVAGAQLAALPEVLEVHHVAGQDSYLVKARVKDPEALGRLLRERFGAIPGVRSTMSTIALETLKEHWSLPIEPLPMPEKERLRA